MIIEAVVVKALRNALRRNFLLKQRLLTTFQPLDSFILFHSKYIGLIYSI